MITPRFKSGPLSRWFLNYMGFAGITSPWRTVYILPEYRREAWLLRHETAHLAQMDRDGWLHFWFWILVWYVYPGYERSPYEIEARETEQNTSHPLIANYLLGD